MIKGGVGGANTKTGLAFELETDFPTLLEGLNGYKIENIDYNTRRKNGEVIIGKKLRLKPKRWKILYSGEEIGQIFQKEGLYRYFDEVYIIEKKTQSRSGSVDEKLQTCDFKLKQYKKLFAPLNKEVSYSYLLDKKWFGQEKYKDVLDYIISIGCKYYYNYIPFDVMGLPLPLEKKL